MFSPCLYVCMYVCVWGVCLCVFLSVCLVNMLIFYFSFNGQGHRDGALLFKGTIISQKLSHGSCENVIQESYVSVDTTLSGNWGRCCQITLLQRCILTINVAATL